MDMIKEFFNTVYYLPARIIISVVLVVLTYTMDRDNMDMVTDFIKATEQAVDYLYDLFAFFVWVVLLIQLCP